MKASVVDLRYKMKKVLEALRRRETVEILYHGKTAGIIIPPKTKAGTKDLHKQSFFGMHRDMGAKAADVEKAMDGLRGGRYRDI